MHLLQLPVPLIVLAVAAPARADESSKNDAASIQVTIDATKSGPSITPFIYGQFIEHLGRCSDIIHMANYAQTVNVIGCIKTTKTAAFFDTTALPLLLYRREFGTLPLAVNGNNGERAIDVAAAKTQDGSAVTIGVVNPQAKSQTIDVTIVGVKRGSTATVWRIAAGDPTAGNTVEKQSVAIAEEKDVPFGEQLTVPAYSASVYRVPLKNQ